MMPRLIRASQTFARRCTTSATNRGSRSITCSLKTSASWLCSIETRWGHCRQYCGRHPMSIISWILLGLVAGFIGSKIVHSEGQGLLLDIVLGIVGAIVGGVLFSAFGVGGITGFNIYSLI